MQGDVCLLKCLVRKALFEQAAQSRGIDRKTAFSQQSQDAAPGEREYRVSAQATPNGLKLPDAVRVRCAGKVGTVDRAYG